MTSERGLWATARRNLAPYGRLVRIESATELGIPDVLYLLRFGVTGWLELKETAWPKRPCTPVFVKSLKLEQVLFLEGWAAAGGRAHVLLQADRSYLLLTPATARAVFHRALTRGEVEAAAVVRAEGKFPTGPILRCLSITKY